MTEYKVVQLDLSKGTVDIEERLNRIAEGGWELVAVTSLNIFIFARPGS